MAGRYKVASKEDRTADNIVFHSRKEMLAYVNQFRPLMRSGIKVELQKRFWLYAAVPISRKTPEGVIGMAEYVADFVVHEKGTIRIYDVKGDRTEMYKLKKKWFEACYPHLRIVEL